MEKTYNSVSFVPEEVEKGLHIKFIQDLLELSKEKDKSYFDIHIWSDGYCTIVDFADTDFEHEDGKFEYVTCDQQVMTEFQLPDRSYVLLESKEEFNNYLADWLKENPGWVQTSYGAWTNEIENEQFRKKMEEREAKDGDE